MQFVRCLVTVLLVASIPPQVFEEKEPSLIHVAGKFEKLNTHASYSAKSTELHWTRRERNSTTDAWSESKNTYSARYSIVDVASRLAGEELFVAGILPNEKSVIERWKFPKKKGRWIYSMSQPTPAIGTPAGQWSASFALHGQVLSMSPLPPTWYAPEITVIMESSDHGFIRSVEADPEGRFLLFNRYPEGDVYRIDLTGSNQTPAVVFSSTQHPELPALGNLTIAQHSSLGRVCIVAPASISRAMKEVLIPPALYLIDSNNDAIFESTQAVALPDYFESRLLDDNDQCAWTYPWRD